MSAPTAEERVAALEERVAVLRSPACYFLPRALVRDIIDAIKAAEREARRAALEEAARWIEDRDIQAFVLCAAVRALAEKEET